MTTCPRCRLRLAVAETAVPSVPGLPAQRLQSPASQQGPQARAWMRVALARPGTCRLEASKAPSPRSSTAAGSARSARRRPRALTLAHSVTVASSGNRPPPISDGNASCSLCSPWAPPASGVACFLVLRQWHVNPLQGIEGRREDVPAVPQAPRSCHPPRRLLHLPSSVLAARIQGTQAKNPADAPGSQKQIHARRASCRPHSPAARRHVPVPLPYLPRAAPRLLHCGRCKKHHQRIDKNPCSYRFATRSFTWFC